MKNSLNCLAAALAALAMFWAMLAIANIEAAKNPVNKPVFVNDYRDCSQGCGMGWQDSK